MNLKELQAMIKEELDAYVNEQEVDVDVDADDVKADGDDSMEMLRKIYDMLKPKFEDMEDMDEAEDMEERASQGFGDPGAKNTAGSNAGYTPAKTTKGDGKLHEGFTARMKKLANIKG